MRSKGENINSELPDPQPMATLSLQIRSRRSTTETRQVYPCALQQITILVFDPDMQITQSMHTSLERCPDMVYRATTTDIIQLIYHLNLTLPDCVLLQTGNYDRYFLSAVKLIHAQFPEVKIIILSATENEEILFEALCAGAYGYILNTQPDEIILYQIKQIGRGQVTLGDPVFRRILRSLSHFHEKPKFDRYMLTNRESEIMNLMLKGNSYKIIAYELDITYHTVHNHIKNIYAKLNVNSMTEAITKVLTRHPVHLP
ncbi:MAG: response regulator transcription factor [Saprospiraceae bacterium]|nr:response regulator transcription factor [Saprospiraceae bacterium]